MTADRSEYLRQWHLRHRTRRLRARKLRYRAHREEELAQAKKWQQRNRTKCRAIQKKCRSRPIYKTYNRERMRYYRLISL